MGYPTKIATCCYCGARAALVLDTKRHELACSSCGAPLHNLKMLPTRAAVDRAYPAPSTAHKAKPKKKTTTYRKSSKPLKSRKTRFWDIAEDVFEFVEDIFD